MTSDPSTGAVAAALPLPDLAAYVRKQLGVIFPDGREPGPRFESLVAGALKRLSHCLEHSIWYSRRGGVPAGKPIFNHLHSDHYALFLLFLASEARTVADEPWLADKIYYLNKSMHALDIYHGVNIPAVLTIVHAVGTVVGRAIFGDYLVLYQNCTIGGNHELQYPTLGRGVVLYAHTRVIGASRIGNNCILSTGAAVINDEVPDNSMVFGQSPKLTIRASRRNVLTEYFQPRP